MSINFKIKDLVYPYFVTEGRDKKALVKDFPGVFRFSVDRLLADVEQARGLGIRRVLLFGLPSEKDALGSSATTRGSILCRAARAVKREFADVEVMTDICLCAYTTHGHCGILKSQDTRHTLAGTGKSQVKIDNKKTLAALSEMAVRHAEAGADWVAPSAMAKRQVAAIRRALDKNGLKRTKVLGYSSKFASNFYGPFRNAARSAPAFGDRSGYQLAIRDSAAALKEIKDDIAEGADMVMVKPALSYLDIIARAKERFSFPLAAYNVSGEYSMVKYGARQGLWDERKMTLEVLFSIKRAGADIIVTYHAKDVAQWLKG